MTLCAILKGDTQHTSGLWRMMGTVSSGCVLLCCLARLQAHTVEYITFSFHCILAVGGSTSCKSCSIDSEARLVWHLECVGHIAVIGCTGMACGALLMRAHSQQQSRHCTRVRTAALCLTTMLGSTCQMTASQPLKSCAYSLRS